MRYICSICNKFVKDKFIFGLLHVCLSDEERLLKHPVMRKPLASILLQELENDTNNPQIEAYNKMLRGLNII